MAVGSLQRVHRAVVALLATVLAALPAAGDVAPEGAAVRVDHAQLRCGSHRVEVATSCLTDQSAGNAFCPLQVVSFSAGGNAAVAAVTFRYQESQTRDQDFIAGVDCLSWGGQHYVGLEGTNFGNCRQGCEWLDIFEESGKYLGTTVPARYRDDGFRRRPLSKALLKKVSGRADWVDSVDIHREN